MSTGYTTGVYDLFRVGHVNMLRNAKSMCDRLIVGVIVDELVAYKNKSSVISFDEKIDGDEATHINFGGVIVKIDPRYFRPAEVETLLGDLRKAKEKLGWTPQITVREMCLEMVAEDLKTAKRHALLKTHGYYMPVAIEI
jgi:cytidyltransferase-like protein